METIAVLFNPTSGRGRSRAKETRIRSTFNSSGIPYEWFTSESENDLRAKAFSVSRSFPVIVAVGGDTTCQIVASEILAAETDTVLGMIAAGSSNDIARSLGICSLDSLISSLRNNRSRRMDAGQLELSGRTEKIYFVGTLSLGLGAEVNRFVADTWRRYPLFARGGIIPQVVAGMSGAYRAFRHNTVPVRVTVDNGETSTEELFSLMVFANIPFYAGGLKLVPESTPFDGRLDCFTLHTRTFGQTLRAGFRILLGRHIGHEDMGIVSGSSFQVSSDDSLSVQYDGELVDGITSLCIQMKPAAIRVLV